MRLPAFLTRLSPVGETLTALEAGEATLGAEVEERNGRLSVSTAGEEGLALWEADCGLPHSAADTPDLRRSRIRAALLGGETLTPARLQALAQRYFGVDTVTVAENAPASQVTVTAFFDDKKPVRDLTALNETLRRRKPAHIAVTVVLKSLWNKVLIRYGTLPAVQSRSLCGGALAGETILFAGGENDSKFAVVDAYDTAFTHTLPTALSTARSRLAGASVGGCALFAGGEVSNGVNTVDAYGSDLTRTAAPALRNAKFLLRGGSIGAYALFCGGENYPSFFKTADAYDASLTRTAAPDASAAHSTCAVARTEGYLLFAGGYGGYQSRTAVTDAYDASLTRFSAGNLSGPRSHFAGASVGGCALFAGGYDASGAGVVTVDAYGDGLTRQALTPLPAAKVNLCSGQTEGFAVFLGGGQATAIAYDEQLTQLMGPAPADSKNNSPSVTREEHMVCFYGGNPEVYQTDYEK